MAQQLAILEVKMENYVTKGFTIAKTNLLLVKRGSPGSLQITQSRCVVTMQWDLTVWSLIQWQLEIYVRGWQHLSIPEPRWRCREGWLSQPQLQCWQTEAPGLRGLRLRSGGLGTRLNAAVTGMTGGGGEHVVVSGVWEFPALAPTYVATPVAGGAFGRQGRRWWCSTAHNKKI